MPVGDIPWGLQKLEAPLACKLNCNIGPFLGNYSSQNKFPANVLASAVMKVCSGDKNIFPYSVGAPDCRWKYFTSFQKVQHFESAFAGAWKYFYSFHLTTLFLFSFVNTFHLETLFLSSFENTFPFFRKCNISSLHSRAFAGLINLVELVSWKCIKISTFTFHSLLFLSWWSDEIDKY